MVYITHTLMQHILEGSSLSHYTLSPVSATSLFNPLPTSPFNHYPTSPSSTHRVDPHIGPLHSNLLQLILDNETGPQTIGQRRPETGQGHHAGREGVLLWQQGNVGEEDEEVEKTPDAGS